MKFNQSVNDFPLVVSLGEKTPSWGLSRWQKKNSLRFVPLDDEGFTLRGDKRRLVYKGRRRSHRFTILGDGAFEYDCILEREPESNVISLVMEGADKFDFFRQPDFAPDDFLKGSYAVYNKETVLGQGTGKLCHIHRPQIIDACGRKCWGDLSVAGNELRITIPQEFLSNAKYPVVVDPTVGTTTIGSQTTWNSDPPEPWSPLIFECTIPLNRFTIPERLEGLCTAYFYPFWDDGYAGGRPVFYSNNNNQPHLRRSTQENWINLRVNGSNPVGWRSGTFRTSEAIPAGTSLWFGLFAEYMWMPRFDYGAVFWEHWWDSGIIPNTYPGYRNQNVANSPYTFRPSMYFTYTSAQNYVRTLTQGVRLTDSRKGAAEYKRNATQAVNGTDNTFYPILFVRTLKETQGVKDIIHKLSQYICGLYDDVGITADTARQGEFYRTENETVNADGSVFRGLLIFIRILTTSFVRDFVLRRFLIAREELVLKSCITRELTLDSKIC